MTFLIAKLRSRIVLIEVGKDKIANITTSIYSHGSLRPKGRDRGYYIASQGSIFPTRIGRVPLAICYDQLAPSVDPKFLLAMKELEKIPVEYDVQRVEPKKNTLIWEKHHRITNITDLQNWLEFAKKHQEKIEFAQLTPEDQEVHVKDCRTCWLLIKGVGIPRASVDISTIGNWVSSNISPSLIETIVETNLRIRMRQNKTLDAKWLVLLPMIIIAAAVAAVIITNILASPPAIFEPNPITEPIIGG